ncbi:lipopolysaccharide biosynthesis protein [Rhizobium sp. SSA_523]|uniref:lipopolysaccharide biosynthesis protein n=1 Tax=Rhizobium sp. SSA_523 TaxID=2952477 RepID=UPI002090E543|nr:lipopolysaccharide biosynthesis protein [Rhizobium sp. SSA_523]MCO5733695.1 lipopolysaccharide biosynthesis protein [Rhizobium sp. SSA_523]WKC25741.1 lipopolysaccharide biosynthesis protein [Rhizobium sp. SSA_523]
MTVIEQAERLLPLSLRVRLAPIARKLDSILTGTDDTARSQRMALTAFSIRIISAAIAFASQIILARLMGEFEYGIFAFVWVLVVVFGNLSCLGFHTVVIRFLPQHQTRGETDLVRGLNWSARVIAMLAASLLAASGFAFLSIFDAMVPDYWMIPVVLGLFTLPMIALGDVLDGTARAHGWAVAAMSPTYIIRPVLILAFMLLSVALDQPRAARTAMEAALAATYVTTLFQFIRISLRLRRLHGRGNLDFDIRSWTGFALPLFLVDGVGFLLTNSDVVVVGLYLPPDQVAIYYAAAKTIALVQFVYFSVKAAAAPRFSAIMASQDEGELATFAVQAAQWAFWPALAVGLFVLALGEFLLALFGPSFTEGYGLMVVLFAGILAKASVGPGEVLLNMAGRQSLCVKIYVLVLACNIALNITLIPYFGLMGAAVATALAMAIEAVLLFLAVRQTLGITLFVFAGRRSAPVGKRQGPHG